MINLYRKATPSARTADEHPLLMDDFNMLRESLTTVETDYFGLTTLVALPLRATIVGQAVRGILGKS